MEFVSLEGLRLDGQRPMEAVFFSQYPTNNFYIFIIIDVKLFVFWV